MATNLVTERLPIFHHAAPPLAFPLEFKARLTSIISACLPALGDCGCLMLGMRANTQIFLAV